MLPLFSPMSAQAVCTSDNDLTQLSAHDRAALNARTNAIRFATGLEWNAQKDGAALAIVGRLHLPDPRHEA